jgi:hypothetical protein
MEGDVFVKTNSSSALRYALAVVYLEFEKERGKSLTGKKFKEQRVYCPR